MNDCPRFELGRARSLRDGDAAVLLCYGATAVDGLAAAELLAESAVEVSVVSARFAKPIDLEMVRQALEAGGPVFTIEDHSVAGGFGSAVLEAAQELELDASRLVRLGMPADRFVAHGSRAGQLAECGYDATGIAAAVQRRLEITDDAVESLRGQAPTLVSR
jgi:1-deoxy-D-xylulose-5-phosphate synthase